MDLRLHRVPVGRGRVDDGKVPRPHHRELQGPRDRCGGEGERVHIHPHLTDLLFCCHAEFLFFVDDQQAEVFEFNILAQDPVGADQDVEGSLFQFGKDLFLRFRRLEPVQVIHPAGELLQAVGEGLEMLKGKDGSGDEDGDLPAFRDHLECRADSDLRLSESDIAADEAVHLIWSGVSS
jgi:hypothetical protein